jgi:phosphoserine phosphatase RsbU/P
MVATIAILSLVIVAVTTGVVIWLVSDGRERVAGGARSRFGSVPRVLRAAAGSVAARSSAAPDATQLGDLYRSVFQSLADALIVIDERGIIRSFSPSAERIFGYAASEVIGQNVSTLMPPPDRYNHDEYLRHYVQSGWSSGRLETLVLTGDAYIIRPERETIAARKDGTPFPARLIVSEVESGGRRMFVGLVSDVSERKRLERELAAQMEAQGALLRQLQEAYAVIEGQKKRMQRELDVGHEIQLSMVPHRFPEMKEAELWATLRPAREVGGDFYDYFTTSAGELWLCIGDVSGKGVPAALFMAVTKTLIKSFAAQGGSPGEVFTRVNAELARDNDSAMFVTAFIARIDQRSGEIDFANAGHNPPLVRRAGGELSRYDRRHGPVLGAVEDAVYKESTDRLAPADVLLLFTDGVTEALDHSEQLFSEARLRDTISEGGDLTARQLVNAVVSAVDAFAGGAEQADDITLLALRFRGAVDATSEPHFPLRLPNTFDALAGALPQVERLVGRCGGSVVAQRRFALAFDELLSNVIRYAYPTPARRMIECELARRNGSIVAVIADDGAPFNPLELEAPDTTLPLDERQIGGLGVHIVRTMFDEVRYERRGSRNVTTIVQHPASLPAAEFVH